MEAVKEAGFKTQGPPLWLWCTKKVSVINKLKDNKPKSGLSLSALAFEKYKPLNEDEQKKLELKKEYKKLKRTAEKNSLDSSISHMVELVIPEKGYLDASDYPPSTWKPAFEITRMASTDRCLACDDPLAFFEKTVCIWCLKEI